LDLRYLISAGADLVTFSGGKQLGGPAAVGGIAGRKDLIEACELTEWTIARTMKVAKEFIVALIIALEEWEKRDWTQWASSTATVQQATRWAQYIYEQLSNKPIPDVEVKLMPGIQQTQVIGKIKYTPPPHVRLILHAGLGISAHEVYEAVAAGDPSVLISNHNENLGFLDINPAPLIEGEEKLVAEKVRKVLTERKKTEEIVPYPFLGAY
jgi:L-seryl-tRNA(Ser) seleniumtransferase/D-glucosaminate-6-phosphate ammonia-lyase